MLTRRLHVITQARSAWTLTHLTPDLVNKWRPWVDRLLIWHSWAVWAAHLYCWRRCWAGVGGSLATQARCLWPQIHHCPLLLLLLPLLAVLLTQAPAPAALRPAAGGLSACLLLLPCLCCQCVLCLLPRAKPRWTVSHLCRRV